MRHRVFVLLIIHQSGTGIEPSLYSISISTIIINHLNIRIDKTFPIARRVSILDFGWMFSPRHWEKFDWT